MSQYHDHHAEDYEDYEGYPDGKDLYDSYVERTMKPSLDEQMNSPEFRLTSLEISVNNWIPTLQKMEKKIKELEKAVFGARLDDFDTQKQVEELNEYDDIEKYAENWQGIETVVAIQTDDGKQAEIKFPSLESALKFCGPNVNTKGK